MKNLITDYLATVSIMSKHSAKEYAFRLNSFQRFVLSHYGGRVTIAFGAYFPAPAFTGGDVNVDCRDG